MELDVSDSIRTWIGHAERLEDRTLLASIPLLPIQDNTLYETVSGNISNGAGSHLFAGQNGSGSDSRALLAFDIASYVPAGSTINDVTLTLNMSRSQTGASDVAVHRVLADWGEGASDATGNEGGGAGAQTDDATWLHTFFDTATWTNAGGDFDGTVSAQTSVIGNGSYMWTGSGLVDDVQGWLNDPASDFGWLLIGNESSRSTKRFDSRENSTVDNRPSLTIDYTPPMDYGDAPDTAAGTGAGNYQTLSNDSGPAHTIDGGLFLGSSIDGDSGILQSTHANADDVDGAFPDDEDGVLDPANDLAGTIGAAPTVTLAVTNTTGSAATLAGWIDYDNDGVFENGNERAIATVNTGTTDDRVTLTFPAVPEGFTGTTYARFRLSTDGAFVANPSSIGSATDGEVEDYTFAITAPSGGTADGFTKIAHELNGGPTGTTQDNFGFSVSSIGDLDGDGVTDLAVGAMLDDTGGVRGGAVHVLFMNADGTVKSSTKIASDTGGGPTLLKFDHFGSSVSGVGDLDGDGVADLAVGAYQDDTGNTDRGAVHLLFMNTDGSVKSATKIASDLNGGPTLVNFGQFGSSVSSVGDLDGDGVADLAVGARIDNTGGSSSGAVYVLFMNTDGTVKSSTKIAHEINGGPTLLNFDHFGRSVSGVGDLDGDGVADLAVGAYRDSTGAVHVLFMNADGTVKNSTKIASGTGGGPTLDDTDRFGTSLSSMGDLDGDGVTDLAVGASHDDTGGFGQYADRGAVHVLLLNVDGTVKSSTKIASDLNGGPTLNDDDFFGISVTYIGDLDGDGVPDLGVGTAHDNTSGLFRGAVYILNLAAPAPSPATVDLPTGGGSYEVLRDSNDLVVRIAGGSELLRIAADTISVLNITGSVDADDVNVLDSGTTVSSPISFTGGTGNDRFDGALTTGPVTLFGNGGDDVLIGGSSDDALNGGSNKDELVGGPGNDNLNGGSGTGDTVDGGDGDDVLNGGSGNDLIRETSDADIVLTNSTMTGRGNDTVISVERATIVGSASGQTIDVSAFFTAGLTSVTVNGGGGDDVIVGSQGSDVLIGGGGIDDIDAGEGNDRAFGGAGADTLKGGEGNDLLKGLGASGDQLIGGPGDDVLNGGRGVDRLIETADVDFTLTTNNMTLVSSLTGVGTDVVQAIEIAELNGGPSANVIDVSAFLGGPRGFVLVHGNGGDDSVIGSAGPDLLNGGDGNDTLQGKEAADTLNGDAGADALSGHEGDDLINGGDFHDIAYGGNGDDTLNGERGVDRLIGGAGDDEIAGGNGNDTLVAGTGNDDASVGDSITDAEAVIDELFTLDPLPGWVDQV